MQFLRSINLQIATPNVNISANNLSINKDYFANLRPIVLDLSSSYPLSLNKTYALPHEITVKRVSLPT